MGSYRVDKMASTVRNIVSDCIANKLSDPRICPMTSVTRVEMTGDLQIARVFVSVMGTEAQARTTMAALTHARGRIQRAVAQGVRARFCPEVRIELDETLKKAAETLQIIKESLGDEASDDTDGSPEIGEHQHPTDGATA